MFCWLSLPYCDSFWRKHLRRNALPRISQLVQKFPRDSTFFKKAFALSFRLSLVPESDAILFFPFLSEPAEKKTVNADRETLAQTPIETKLSPTLMKNLSRFKVDERELSRVDESTRERTRIPGQTRARVFNSHQLALSFGPGLNNYQPVVCHFPISETHKG